MATQMKRKRPRGEKTVMIIRTASRVLLSTKSKKASGQNVEVGGLIWRWGIFEE